MRKSNKIALVVFSLFVASFGKAQTPNNLSLFFGEVDSAAQIISNKCEPATEYSLEILPAKEFNVFLPSVINVFNSNKIKIVKGSADGKILISVESAKVSYGKVFRASFFGDFKTERRVLLAGSYSVLNSRSTACSGNFSFVRKDTVLVSEIKELEKPGFSFTKGIIPEEPFWASFFEPLIALSAVIVSIYLLFSVRSK